MNIADFLNPVNIFGKIVDKISNYQLKKKEKEINKIQAQSKLDLARQSGATEVTLKDAEWEAISVSKSDSTWKDEYVTLIITYPLIGVLLGTLIQAFTGDATLLDGTLSGVSQLKGLGMDYGTLMTIVVSAAVSIKAASKLRG